MFSCIPKPSLSVARTRLPSKSVNSIQQQFRLSSTHRHPAASHTHTHGNPHTHNHHGRVKRSHALTATLTASCAAFVIGALYPPDVATLVSPRPAPGPLHPESDEAKLYLEQLEQQLQALPALAKVRNAPDATEWYETRPYKEMPEEYRVNSLTAGALRGPGKLSLAPLLRAKHDETETVMFTHFGRGLCGHDGIIHGGLIATVLDESLGRLSIMNLPEKVGVTATLTIDYKAPTKADQFVVVRCRLVELKGRKAVVEGQVEDLNGVILAKARGIFIQPKYAKLLSQKMITKALGQPPAVSDLSVGEKN